jgi:hypothetical protein
VTVSTITLSNGVGQEERTPSRLGGNRSAVEPSLVRAELGIRGAARSQSPMRTHADEGTR